MDGLPAAATAAAMAVVTTTQAILDSQSGELLHTRFYATAHDDTTATGQDKRHAPAAADEGTDLGGLEGEIRRIASFGNYSVDITVETRESSMIEHQGPCFDTTTAEIRHDLGHKFREFVYDAIAVRRIYWMIETVERLRQFHSLWVHIAWRMRERRTRESSESRLPGVRL